MRKEWRLKKAFPPRLSMSMKMKNRKEEYTEIYRLMLERKMKGGTL